MTQCHLILAFGPQYSPELGFCNLLFNGLRRRPSVDLASTTTRVVVPGRPTEVLAQRAFGRTSAVLGQVAAPSARQTMVSPARSGTSRGDVATSMAMEASRHPLWRQSNPAEDEANSDPSLLEEESYSLNQSDSMIAIKRLRETRHESRGRRGRAPSPGAVAN